MTNSGRVERPFDPDDADPGDYLRAIEDGDSVLHIYLTDDKEWWIAHNEDGEYLGKMNGPWLHWHTYPTGAITLDFCTKGLLRFHIDNLYYIDYYGNETHSVHDLTLLSVSDAPEFVRAEIGEVEL